MNAISDEQCKKKKKDEKDSREGGKLCRAKDIEV